ncbi:hypothetical protein [Sulfitobacter sp.]|uniref:hypothetical protein n=1 Tax=Sulfitobacter sp. TaxID=1903071 RepID=UPI0030036804
MGDMPLGNVLVDRLPEIGPHHAFRPQSSRRREFPLNVKCQIEVLPMKYDYQSQRVAIDCAFEI